MRRTLRFGRLFGIDIHLDASWLLVLALIAWNVTVVFRAWHPTWAIWPALILATIATAALFVSLLAHELAHAFVGHGLGMRVRHLRLSFYGGVSEIEPQPRSPAAEFWMAIAGPVLSLSVGTVLWFAARRSFGAILDPVEAMARLSPFLTVVYWIGPMNIALGLLHLVPGFPLDGGRILRAAIWKATGDLRRATVIAATSGSVIGIGLTVLGLGMAFGIDLPFVGSGLRGLWLALIGLYLRAAAERSLVETWLEQRNRAAPGVHFPVRSSLS